MANLKGILTAAGLAGTAGYVNAVAYLGLHAFVAPMTGTVILVGFALADANLAEAARGALMVMSFLAGVTVARLLRRFGHGPAPCWALSAILLGGSAFRALEGLPALIPIACAVGCLNGSETKFGTTTLNTTFITGNLERLGEALADTSFQNRGAQATLIGAILLAYVGGATSGAIAAHRVAHPLLLPAGALMLAALLAWHRQRDA